jgi:hypothetical protein
MIACLQCLLGERVRRRVTGDLQLSTASGCGLRFLAGGIRA